MRLGPTEFRLLEFLMESSGRVLSRAQLLDGVWGRDAFVDERTVDVHIGRLRKALIRGNERDPIRTVRSAGRGPRRSKRLRRRRSSGGAARAASRSGQGRSRPGPWPWSAAGTSGRQRSARHDFEAYAHAAEESRVERSHHRL